jgi:hypothetical protein
MAHSPLQPAQALLYQKPKSKDKHPSPLALLSFVRPHPVSSDPRDVIQVPEPCDVIKALDPFARLLLRRPHCNTLLWVRMGPYLSLLRNRSSLRRAGLPGNL